MRRCHGAAKRKAGDVFEEQALHPGNGGANGQGQIDFPIGEARNAFLAGKIVERDARAGVLPLKKHESSREKPDGERRCIADMKSPARFVGDGMDRIDRLVHAKQNGPRFVQENLAGLGQGERLGRAAEKFHTELGFEIANLAAQRRLRDMEPGRGARDVLFLGHDDKIAKMSQFHGASIPKRNCEPSNIVFRESRMLELVGGNERTL